MPPNFFGSDDPFGELDGKLNITTLMFNVRFGGGAKTGATPFVSGGAGSLRELHEGNLLVETGTEYHATAGLKYWFGGGDNRFGLRVEGGVSAREKGFDDQDRRRVQPMVAAGLSYVF